jgi:CBS domain-containing protein
MAENKSPNVEEFEDPLSNYEPKQYDNAVARALDEETVTAIQVTPFAEISANVTVAEALRSLRNLNVSCLLVTEGRRLLGIFTERDVLEKLAEDYQQYSSAPLADVMTTNPLVVYQSNPAGTALAAIAAAGYRHVPVLDSDDNLVGVVSPRRVFSFIAKYM